MRSKRGVPAFANTVSVSTTCPGSWPGGTFLSKGQVMNLQEHSKPGESPKQFNYTGTQWRTGNWGGGWVGFQGASLWSPNTFVGKSASCPG